MRAVFLLLLALGTLCGCMPSSTRFPTDVSQDVWEYEIEFERGANTLRVRGDLASNGRRKYRVEGTGRPFLVNLSVEHGSVEGAGVDCDPPGCRVAYRFLLRATAHGATDSEMIFGENGAYAAPAPLWLLHAEKVRARTIRMRVRPTDPVFIPGRLDSGGAFELHDVSLDETAYFAFGAWRAYFTYAGATPLQIVISPGSRLMSDASIGLWVQSAAQTVASYFGAFPGAQPLVLVVPARGDAIDAKTLGGAGASIFAELGSGVTENKALDDWVLVHEMIHAALPSLGPPHQWLEEGLATYLEPLARARAGSIDPKRVWREWVREMPQGLPGPGDQGLEHTHSWERTYWGGAVFCLLADTLIRKRTENARSLDDALRAIARLSGGVASHWTIDRIIEVGDAATGGPELHDLYGRLALAPGQVNLDALFRELGVTVQRGEVVFDDAAPEARPRRSLTQSDRSPEKE